MTFAVDLHSQTGSSIPSSSTANTADHSTISNLPKVSAPTTTMIQHPTTITSGEAAALAGTDSSNFTRIPILSLSKARDPKTKQEFLSELLNALLHVGFLYLDDTGVPQELIDKVCKQTRLFFDERVLPYEEKERIEMKNEKSFLGWSRLNNETTAGRSDYREQLDLSTPQPLPGPESPLYHNLKAPNQWPSANYLPEFRSTFEEYMLQLTELSVFFTSLVAEALGMPPTAFDQFFDQPDQQHKLKLVKYPEAPTESDDPADRQGVGPHKDSMLTSYLLQVSKQPGLQAQNLSGDWVDALPIDGTLVVAFGQGLEALTGGVCRSTTHRVLSPRKGQGERFSVPFFQGVSYDAKFEEMDVPQEVRKLGEQVAEGGRKDDVEFTFKPGRWGHLGEATLANRVKSHPDVGERWYPDLLAKIREDQARERPEKAK